MPIHPRLRLSTLAALLLCATGCAPPSLPFSRLAGLITNGELDEVSGIAASRVHDDVLWAVEDSGNPARLYAISRRGRVLARYSLEGAKNKDWEDLASFDLDGKHYLLLADTGDNGGQRRDFILHVFEEPSSLRNGTLKPAAGRSTRRMARGSPHRPPGRRAGGGRGPAAQRSQARQAVPAGHRGRRLP
jgi:hypothetical protein